VEEGIVRRPGGLVSHLQHKKPREPGEEEGPNGPFFNLPLGATLDHKVGGEATRGSRSPSTEVNQFKSGGGTTGNADTEKWLLGPLSPVAVGVHPGKRAREPPCRTYPMHRRTHSFSKGVQGKGAEIRGDGGLPKRPGGKWIFCGEQGVGGEEVNTGYLPGKSRTWHLQTGLS